MIICINSCSQKEPEEIIVDNTNNCNTSNISVSENDKVVIPDATNPVLWKGHYNNSNVKISFTISAGVDNETETLNFVFDKIDKCLKINRAYKFYDGKLVDVSAITEMNVVGFTMQNWEIDKKFSGIISYVDPHNKKTYNRKFWVEFSTDDYYEEPTQFELFSDCFADKLPIPIDMNNDGNIDFNLSYEELRDSGNKPAYSQYTIKLISTDSDKNFILSPKRNSSPYFVIFEPPFSSNNTRQYFNGVKNALDVFYEFDAPYKKYNYLLNNNLTYKKILENNLYDYYVVSVHLNGNAYFGWIKFKFNATSCSMEILDTFLNPNANEHINVN